MQQPSPYSFQESRRQRVLSAVISFSGLRQSWAATVARVCKPTWGKKRFTFNNVASFIQKQRLAGMKAKKQEKEAGEGNLSTMWKSVLLSILLSFTDHVLCLLHFKHIFTGREKRRNSCYLEKYVLFCSSIATGERKIIGFLRNRRYYIFIWFRIKMKGGKIFWIVGKFIFAKKRF